MKNQKCGVFAFVSGVKPSHCLVAATYYALQAASVVDVFGKLRVPAGFALLFVSVGIANVATVPIAGTLHAKRRG